MSGQWLGLALKVALTLWLVTVSAWDRLERRVPNWLVLPVMFGAFFWQIYSSVGTREFDSVMFVVISWVVLFAMWQAHVFGGGDTKVLMALFAMFPSVQFLILFSLVKLVASIPLLVIKYAGTGFRDLFRGVRQRVVDGQMLPKAGELRIKGSSYCWTYALPGVIYLWWAL